MTDQTLIDIAADHTSAHEHDLGEAGRFYSYTEGQMGAMVFVVTDEDMLELGRDLDRNRADAYSHWCSETSATEVTIESILAVYPRAAEDSDEAIRDALANGDVELLAGISHLDISTGREAAEA